MTSGSALIALRDVSKLFGAIIALDRITFEVRPAQVHCLLGDNGAGKSTLIKILAGVHRPDKGEIFFAGRQVHFSSPADALDCGIATVHQDLAMVPLMSVTRNFFMGRELTRYRWPFRIFDLARANTLVMEQLAQIGMVISDPGQPVGTLSGGQRQCVAIARAIYFGAKVLILDEPTSALGVQQASMVLRYIAAARSQGVAVIFITHNINHAYPIGDVFTLLSHGTSLGTYAKTEISRDEVLSAMASGNELSRLTSEFDSTL